MVAIVYLSFLSQPQWQRRRLRYAPELPGSHDVRRLKHPVRLVDLICPGIRFNHHGIAYLPPVPY